jgi:hypothetical protein
MPTIDTERLYAIIADKEAILRARWGKRKNFDAGKYIYTEREIGEIEGRLACLEGMRQAIDEVA